MKEIRSIGELKTREDIDIYLKISKDDLYRLLDHGRTIQIEAVVESDSEESVEIINHDAKIDGTLASVISSDVKSLKFNFKP